jgi:predicted MPP superfamily phosphohydrolase
MRSPLSAVIFLAIVLLLDTYVFQAIKTVTLSVTPRTRIVVYTIFWSISVLVIAGLLVYSFASQGFIPKQIRSYIFAIIVGLFLAKLVAVLFILLDDIRRLVTWLVVRLSEVGTKQEPGAAGEGITRSVFLSWLGLAAGGGLFSTLVYGFGNKYRYDVKKVPLHFTNLPGGFKGMKVVQISDIHSGSLHNLKAVEKGIDLILAQKPDMILFTGDLVNDMAIEMKEHEAHFARLKAPLGVYSILGNHDYGDYAYWPNNGITKAQNLENLKQVHARMGWRLLMNEHVPIERNGDKLALIGIENWSAKARFPKHGRLDLAYQGAAEYPFKILMSHDPSHWDAQVKPAYPTIDLMLSGHTHGMQFGVEIPGFKWSPVQYMYKQWGGLYETEKQKLYVNRGFGFIGYPGRVGILPEITVLEFV